MKTAIALFAGLLIGLGGTYAAERTGVINLASDEAAPPTTTTSTSTTEPAPSTTTTTAGVDPASALWPAPSSDDRFDSPEAVARDFAIDFLRIPAPSVGAFQQGDPSSGEVVVKPRDPGPTTRILVRQLQPGFWWVTGCVADNIQVNTPQPGALATSPLKVKGAAHTFEGNVQVEIRADGATKPVGTGFVTGAGDRMGPFEGEIVYDSAAAKPAAYGAVVFFEGSGEDGSVTQATVHRLRF